jgi:hypothetical protein
MDSSLPKEPAILKDERHLNEFALQLCCAHGIPEHDIKGHPANIFEMNTSIDTLSIQCGDENWKESEAPVLLLSCGKKE